MSTGSIVVAPYDGVVDVEACEEIKERNTSTSIQADFQ